MSNPDDTQVSLTGDRNVVECRVLRNQLFVPVNRSAEHRAVLNRILICHQMISSDKACHGRFPQDKAERSQIDAEQESVNPPRRLLPAEACRHHRAPECRRYLTEPSPIRIMIFSPFSLLSQRDTFSALLQILPGLVCHGKGGSFALFVIR